jgi:methylmalonic aciduria homocystinuria type C protein
MDKDGFGIFHRFDARAVAEELGVPRLADPERPVGILIGSTRWMWGPFKAALEEDPALASDPDPIDRFTEKFGERMCAAMHGTAVYSHRLYDGAFLPFQRIAVAAGFAALAPTHLLVHPTYGPWFALRAVILAGGDVPPRTTATLPCACDESCLGAFDAARAASGPDAWRAWLAVRDACPVGRKYRYFEDQLAYHYTKDRRLLVG